MNHNALIATLAILAVVAVAGCTSQVSTNLSTGGAAGNAIFGVKDAAANMQSVSRAEMTVDRVQVHSVRGWTTVSSTAMTYDLMELRADGSTRVLADANLAAGSYDQMKLDISSITVVDAKGSHQAVMPAHEFNVAGNLVVQADAKSTATFDFVADESLHVTSEGTYVFAPVAEVETRENAEVQTQATISGNARLLISGGQVDTNAKVGMNADGNVGVGLNIPASANLAIDSSGKVNIAGLTAGGSGSGGIGI